jgi:hypothetical protein
MKTEFVTIKPKTEEAQEYFESFMRNLHSCRVIRRQNSKVLLNSIAGEYVFWMNEKEDRNWQVIK